MSIKGNVLNFTDDKAKRYEINNLLGRIAATARAVYKENNRQGKGAIRQKCQKKIHVFEDQLKSWQLDITNNHDDKLRPAVG